MRKEYKEKIHQLDEENLTILKSVDALYDKVAKLEKEDLMIVESLDNLCDKVAKIKKDFETLVTGLVVTMALSGCKEKIKKETPKKTNKKKETK